MTNITLEKLKKKKKLLKKHVPMELSKWGLKIQLSFRLIHGNVLLWELLFSAALLCS